MAKLSKLALENYRNIPSLEINFEGRDGKITGMNRIGKTNVLESICYLLTDKLLGGSADIPSIKRHDEPRAKVVVEGIFYTEDGEVTLRKEFYEKWVRPRGSATEELQGHATDYYINGAKQARAKDFFDALESKFGIPTQFNGLDAYQLVLDPFYLGETICGSKDWKLARKAIIEIVGDVTPEEIYERNPDAAIARQDLLAHQYDDAEAKKAIRGEIDGYKKRMIANEGLLAEYRRALDNNVTDEEHAEAQAQAEAIDEQIAKLKVGSENPYAQEVSALQEELFTLQTEYRKTAMAVVDHTVSEELRRKITAKQEEISAIQRQQRSVQFDADQISREISDRSKRQAEYKAQLVDLQNQYKSVTVEETCPTCGQPLPPEKIEEAANKKKAEILAEYERIKGIATENKKAILTLQDKLLALQQRDFGAEESKLNLEYVELNKQLNQALADEAARVTKPDPNIQKRIGEINARLSEIRELQSKGNAGASEQIAILKAKKDGLQAIFSRRIAAESAARRIAEIKKENVEIGKKQADAEQRYWAVGEYVKTKLQLLDEHMASKLGEVRFQLIKENIKAGSYDEVCVPFIISPATGKHTQTLFSDGSKSEQIYTGCRIIQAIRNAKNWLPLPVLFDQGGELDAVSVTKVSLDAEAQIIAVKVEGDSKTPKFIPFN